MLTSSIRSSNYGKVVRKPSDEIAALSESNNH